MSEFLNNVVAKLPEPVQPYVKAFVPVVLAVAVAAQDLAFDAVEVNEIRTLAIGAVTAVLTFAIPNVKPGVVEVPVPPAPEFPPAE